MGLAAKAACDRPLSPASPEGPDRFWRSVRRPTDRIAMPYRSSRREPRGWVRSPPSPGIEPQARGNARSVRRPSGASGTLASGQEKCVTIRTVRLCQPALNRKVAPSALWPNLHAAVQPPESAGASPPYRSSRPRSADARLPAHSGPRAPFGIPCPRNTPGRGCLSTAPDSTRTRRRFNPLSSTAREASDERRCEGAPRDTPDYHSRQAAHLRALAESTTTARLKARLLKTPNSTKSSPLWRMKRQSARLSVETRRAVPARSAADLAAESIALAQLAAECPSWIGRQLRAHAAGRRGCSRLRAGAIKRK